MRPCARTHGRSSSAAGVGHWHERGSSCARASHGALMELRSLALIRRHCMAARVWLARFRVLAAALQRRGPPRWPLRREVVSPTRYMYPYWRTCSTSRSRPAPASPKPRLRPSFASASKRVPAGALDHAAPRRTAPRAFGAEPSARECSMIPPGRALVGVGVERLRGSASVLGGLSRQAASLALADPPASPRRRTLACRHRLGVAREQP